MNFATNIHHASGSAEKIFGVIVKVTSRPNALLQWRHIF